jgi:hypothetical protein
MVHGDPHCSKSARDGDIGAACQSTDFTAIRGKRYERVFEFVFYLGVHDARAAWHVVLKKLVFRWVLPLASSVFLF